MNRRFLFAVLLPLAAFGQTVESAREAEIFIGPDRTPPAGLALVAGYQQGDALAGPWTNRTDAIKDFEFWPGHASKLLVRIEKLNYGAPVADAPMQRTILVEYMKRELVALANSAPADVEGATWKLSAIEDLNTRGVTPAPSNAPTLKVVEGVVSGFAGCNTYSGSVTLGAEHRSFEVGALATTKMLCPGEPMKTEQTFLALLAQARYFAIQKGRLILFNADGTSRAVFTLAVPAPKPIATNAVPAAVEVK
jgi:heat shock protein HslJ